MGVKLIGSERSIFRPDIWWQDPQLHWYAIGFNTARSVAMYFFAKILDGEHSLDVEECSKHEFKSVGLHFTIPKIDKVWDGSTHNRNMVEGARERVCTSNVDLY